MTAPANAPSPDGAESAPKVLVVDDDDSTRRLITFWLTKAKLSCLEANSGEKATQAAAANAGVIDAIVLDVMMPGIDGFETLGRLKADPATASIPVILLTAHATDEVDVVRAVEAGAVDHLAKPFSGPVLVAKVRALCDQARVARQLRSRLAEAEVSATLDPLTGLGNRRLFETRLAEECAFARRHHQPFSCLMLDIDHFKKFNDTFGHKAGDRVLVHVAEAMRAVLRAEDGAFRYGGEEFVLLLRACDATAALVVGDRLRGLLRDRPVVVGDPEERRVISFSGGVASASPRNGFEGGDLVARGDAALYEAKRAGRDRVLLAEGDR